MTTEVMRFIFIDIHDCEVDVASQEPKRRRSSQGINYEFIKNQLGIIKSELLVTIMRDRASVNGLNSSCKKVEKHGILTT